MGNAKRLKAAIWNAIAGSGRVGWPPEQLAGDRTGLAAITFRDYMAMCLYDERDGYYRSGAPRIGRGGDFYTSSAIGSIMGDKVGSFIDSLAKEAQGSVIRVVEWGAGTGTLSRQLLAAWGRSQPSWLQSAELIVVDSSPVHLDEARSRMTEWKESDSAPTIAPSVKFMTPEDAEQALLNAERDPTVYTIVIANELLDAFPVHRLIKKRGQLHELGVAVLGKDEEQDLGYVHMPLSDERLQAVLERDAIEPLEGQIIEVNLEAEQWIMKLGGLISRGSLLLIDYGHEARELAAPHRMNGTLLCYKQHIARDEPFLDPGEQDITAHVNFSACMAAGRAAGWGVNYYGTQKGFLVEQGVLSDFALHDGMNPFSQAARHNRAIRQLLLSDGMSETFKVLALCK